MDPSQQNLFPKIALVLSTLSTNNRPNSSNSWLSAAKEKIFKVKDEELFKIAPNDRVATIERFLEQLDQNTDSPSSIYIFALCLLKKLESKSCYTHLTPSTTQGVYGACWTLAFKFLEDEVFSAEDFGIIIGMSKTKHIKSEVHYLEVLGYNLTISTEEMNAMSKVLDSIWISRSAFPTKKLLSRCTTLSELFESINKMFHQTITKSIVPNNNNENSVLALRKKSISATALFPHSRLARKSKSQEKFSQIPFPPSPSASPVVLHAGAVFIVL